MRKSGWAAVTGLGSLVLLLAACGGSPSTSNSAAGTASGTAVATASGSSGAPQASTSASASQNATGGSTASAKPHHTAGPQPSSGQVSFDPKGTTVMIVQHSNLGYVLAQANGQVVYVYAKDKKNGSPTCTGSCATQWPPVTGTPKAGPADHFPAGFGVVRGAGGVEQITYNGLPLYTFLGAKQYVTTGNGVGGVWHVVKLSASDISGG